ncbi:hypothetical protein FD755_006952 [Muntiacus reevesi]|uniref:Acyltransferase n=1 Tax=Muntiacus reevesi TaxID=9886 RepID=A0A5J5MYC9_MUNRE|nr:hypothetical protein FD755_006952 [Muntiacus reevesi]
MQSGLGPSGWAICLLLQPFPHKIFTAPGRRPRWHIPYPASQPQAVASPDQPIGEVHGKCGEPGDGWGSEHGLHIHRRSLEATRGSSLRPERLPASSLGALLAEGEHLGVSTALLPSPTMKTLQKQQLEVLSTYKYVFCFLFMGPFFSLLGVFLLFTSLWWLSVLHAVWLFLDWDIPYQGERLNKGPGRRGDKGCLWEFFPHTYVLWKHMRDYFPIKLIKTAELPSNWSYALVTHPHGILGIRVFCNFCTEVTGSSQQFPRLWFSLAILNSLFYLPVYQDYVMSYGTCSVNHQSLEFILSQPQLGQAVLILVGGAHEALHAIPGEHCLTLRNRKGFVRLALRHGTSLVPVYSFGENDIFRVKAFAPDSWQRLFQVTIKKVVGISPSIFWGRGLFSAKSWGLVPLARLITTVMGRPILVPQCRQPTEEQVDHYHMLYMKALEQLFEEHKESCGLPASTRLTFI